MEKLNCIFKDKNLLKILFLICFCMSVAYICNDIINFNYSNNIYQYILFFVLNCITLSIVYGYFIKFIFTIIQNTDNTLPKIKIIDDFKTGFKYFLSIAILLLIAFCFKASLLIINKDFYKSIEPTFVITFLVLFFLFLPACTWIFATKRYLLSYISFGKAFLLIKKNFISYIKTLILFMFLFGIVTLIRHIIVIIDNKIDSNFIALLIVPTLDAIITSIEVFIGSIFIAKAIRSEDVDLI